MNRRSFLKSIGKVVGGVVIAPSATKAKEPQKFVEQLRLAIFFANFRKWEINKILCKPEFRKMVVEEINSKRLHWAYEDSLEKKEGLSNDCALICDKGDVYFNKDGKMYWYPRNDTLPKLVNGQIFVSQCPLHLTVIVQYFGEDKWILLSAPEPNTHGGSAMNIWGDSPLRIHSQIRTERELREQLKDWKLVKNKRLALNGTNRD